MKIKFFKLKKIKKLGLRKILDSFQIKVTIALILSLFFMMALTCFLICKFGLSEQLNQIRQRLMVIAQTASLMVDADLLNKIPLNREGINSPAYKEINYKLNKIKSITPYIKYIYTMTTTKQVGILQFIVDPDPILEEKGLKGPSAFPGDRYYAARFPEMLRGFEGPSADKKIAADEWGVTISGYAPIRDKNGKTIAILGVDMSAEDVYKTQRQLYWRALIVFILGVFVCIGWGILVSRRVTDRIEKIVEATRHIAADDLDFKLEVKGHDEITELAGSFNKMAISLSESRQKLHDYFFRVVQSLVRFLEAKDPYTCGHSQRVAEYSEKIATAMGFSEAKTELLKKAAELHDIGKLAIHENILNKKEKLTPEEWKVIREHPLMGEELLKPVLIDDEVMKMVRSHHERYDGKGYPDKIKGDNISIFAQIISVADAYDAMTSPRAYRATLSKEKAIAELKANCGTQFNTQIVEAFLKII